MALWRWHLYMVCHDSYNGILSLLVPLFSFLRPLPLPPHVIDHCSVIYTTANKSLAELRQLYFKMKDRVFGSDRFGFGYNTEALEKLLKDEFGTSMRLDSITTPKYVCCALS